MWLLFRLCLFPGELSPYAQSRLRWAFLLNVLTLFVWSAVLWASSYYLPELPDLD